MGIITWLGTLTYFDFAMQKGSSKTIYSKSTKDKKSLEKQKLAEALRKNLRRRKQAKEER